MMVNVVVHKEKEKIDQNKETDEAVKYLLLQQTGKSELSAFEYAYTRNSDEFL